MTQASGLGQILTRLRTRDATGARSVARSTPSARATAVVRTSAVRRPAASNSNAIIRWEYLPGCVLGVVWQQVRVKNDVNLAPVVRGGMWRILFAARPENTVLVQMSYWVNP